MSVKLSQCLAFNHHLNRYIECMRVKKAHESISSIVTTKPPYGGLKRSELITQPEKIITSSIRELGKFVNRFHPFPVPNYNLSKTIRSYNFTRISFILIDIHNIKRTRSSKILSIWRIAEVLNRFHFHFILLRYLTH